MATEALIIATYNWHTALDKCLQSICNQTKIPYEIIIADDGSTIETKNVIEAFKDANPHLDIKHIWHEDTGFKLSAIRNKAIMASTADYIIQIDGDIILAPNFIEDHMQFAQKGFFITGSRLLLNEAITKELLESKEAIDYSILRWKGTNFLNSLRIPFLTKMLQYRYKTKGGNLYYVKGCHMSFWKQDLITVDGYDEAYTGWGREDTDICIRLINAGVQKKFLKFSAVQYHLYHAIFSRENLAKNDQLLEKLIKEKRVIASSGMSKQL